MSLLSGAISLGSRNPVQYLAVRHRPRGWDWIDPEKAAKGAILAIENGLGTRTSFLAERGEDVEDVFRELARENALAAEYGITIDGEAPADDLMTAEEWTDKQAAEAEDGAGGGGNGDARELATSTVGTARRPRPAA